MRYAAHTSRTTQATYFGMMPRDGLMIALLTATTMMMSGCLVGAAAAGAGAGYAVGHEQGEDHVQDGVHHDDD